MFGQTWSQNSSRSTGLVMQCRLHQKSIRQTNSKDISWRQQMSARLPSGTEPPETKWHSNEDTVICVWPGGQVRSRCGDLGQESRTPENLWSTRPRTLILYSGGRFAAPDYAASARNHVDYTFSCPDYAVSACNSLGESPGGLWVMIGCAKFGFRKTHGLGAKHYRITV